MFFLTIAASDSSGAAGIQQDLKMAQRTGFWGLSVVTAITSQNFQRAVHIEYVSESAFVSQLEIIFDSFKISAIKIGVLPTKRFAHLLVKYLDKANCPVVYDPVCLSSSGFRLLQDDPMEILNIIRPRCDVITPNIPEFEFLFGDPLHSKLPIEEREDIYLGNTAIYLKGGHAEDEKIVEYLIHKQTLTKFEYEKLEWKFNRGTGCAFSSLLSMHLMESEIKIACKKARESLVEYYNNLS